MAKTKLIVNLSRGGAVCVGELADRPLPRMRGLMGRRGLPAGEGLLLSPAPAIHTAFMRFPIDALFLDRSLRVLRIAERVRPWRFASKRRASCVLELAAGECARRGVAVGDRLELRDRVADAGVEDPPAAGNGSAGETATEQPKEGGVARLQPLRLLVASPDRKFRTVMSLLLARRNFSVTTTPNAGRIAELALRESTDVVVVDTSRLPSASAVATVEALVRPVGVVLVADELRSGPDDPSVLAKWGPFDDLLEAIERADEGRANRRGRAVSLLAARTALAAVPRLLRSPAGIVPLALAAAALAFVTLPLDRAFVGAFAAVTLVVLSAIDIQRGVIPNRIVLPAAAIVLIANTALFPDRALEWVLAAILAPLVLAVPQLFKRAWIGMGDVKLALLLGATLGWGVPEAILMAFVCASPIALSVLLRGGIAARRTTIPFGPFMALGALIVLFADPLLDFTS